MIWIMRYAKWCSLCFTPMSFVIIDEILAIKSPQSWSTMYYQVRCFVLKISTSFMASCLQKQNHFSLKRIIIHAMVETTLGDYW